VPPVVLFFGGNGHAAARLDGVRRVLAARDAPFELVDAAYPGFEGRAPAADLEAFVDVIAGEVERVRPALIYATGIGGLLALALRAGIGSPPARPSPLRGEAVILQGAILWGLEHRWLPRIAKRWPIRLLLPRLFAWGWYQRRFVKKKLLRPLSDEERQAFFDGYARCSAFADLFVWLASPLLRRLEAAFAERPERLDAIRCWWGARDAVVGKGELAPTERALGRSFPLRTFEAWGHYPMIDDPEGWVAAVAEQL
jgi:hypothetical protein